MEASRVDDDDLGLRHGELFSAAGLRCRGNDRAGDDRESVGATNRSRLDRLGAALCLP